MTTYYITFLAVLTFSVLAQACDRPRVLDNNGIRVRHSSRSGFFYFFVVAILVCAAGFRYNVGADYAVYYHLYYLYARELGGALRELREPVYPFLAWLAVRINNDGATAIFLASFFTILPAMLVIYRHVDRILLPTILFVLLGCWDGSFNGTRQYLAATMLFCGYQYLVSKQFWRYLVFVLLAFLCHRSAIVMVALYFVVYARINVRNLVLVITGTILVFLSYERVLDFAGWITESDYSLDYGYTSHAVNFLRVLAASAPMVLFLILYWNRERSERETIYLNLLTIHAAMRIATMSSALLYRIGIYTTLFQTIAIPGLLNGIPKKTRRTITMVMVPLYIIFWWYELYSNSSLNTFRWIWSI